MSTTATATAVPPMVAQFLQTLGHEHTITMKLLKALPEGKLDFQPHERSWTAGKLAWHVGYSLYGLARWIRTGDMNEYKEPDPPSTVAEIVSGAEKYYQQTCEEVSQFTPERLAGTLEFPGGHMPVSAMFWTNLFHHIHHRGQLSVYIRMMGGKVPSIYGPSADDNPFG